MPRIAYLSKTEDEFYQRPDRMMDIAARSLKTKRTVITKLLDAGLYPYTKYYLGTFENHFSTIGLVGMNEACLNARWLHKDLTDPEAQEFTKAVLNHMRERLSDYQKSTAISTTWKRPRRRARPTVSPSTTATATPRSSPPT